MANAMSHPARGDTLAMTRHCAGFADTMVVLLRQTGRVATDLETYDNITRIAGTYTESDIMTAAISLAQDATEPDLARVAGLSILLNYVTVGNEPVPPSALANYTGPGTNCVSSTSADDLPLPGTNPLPNGYRATILSAAQSVLAGSASTKVKFLANCLVKVLTPLPEAINQPENPSFDHATDFESGRIAGVMRDSVSGAAIVRGFACTEFVSGSPAVLRVHCGTTGEAGEYRIDSIPPGVYKVRATCAGGSRFGGRLLAERAITVPRGAAVEWNIGASAVGCDQRPMERSRGRFVGLWFSDGFETSWFLVDGRTNLVTDADFTHNTRWPESFLPLPDSADSRCIRVTLAGTLHGPLYNIRDMMQYTFDVDTVVAARPVSEEQCFKVVERFLPSVRDIVH